MTSLEELTEELERLANRLRAGDLDPHDAARLVDDCARVAAAAASELDRAARTAGDPGAQ
jgi:hypothetical protein